jgi:hypothetical protein
MVQTWMYIESNIEEIHDHLVHRGFMSGYTCCTKNGEDKEVVHEVHLTIEEDQSNNVIVHRGRQ